MASQRLSLPFIGALLALTALALGHTVEIRERAEAALGAGMPEREADLSRGFVLGEDDGIDRQTVEDFRRSGLSHLLAVSGQNIALLALLAMPVLAAFGIPLRSRLLWVLGLIAMYVPLAGAGASVQRAGVMGALTVIATLAGRRASRLYALVVAAVVTLAIDPRIAADIGWQLSFAAVLGIFLLVDPIRAAIGVNGAARSAKWLRPVLDAMAMTTAATLATAPLIAFHFESISTTTLVANLLALPAVAPAMWLGMLAAAAGQVPGLPVGVLNALDAPVLAYIAQVAAWCGRPDWAYVDVRLDWRGLAASYVVIAGGVLLLLRLRRRRRMAMARRKRERGGRAPSRIRPALLGGVGLLAAVLSVAAWAPDPGAGSPRGAPTGLRVSVLDVGQGDAILLQPAGAPAVLVDGGPPGDDLDGKLRGAGVDRLGAVVVTHDQADHAGGVSDLLGAMPIDRLFFSAMERPLLEEARVAGSATRRVAAGNELRSGALHLQVLWPPRELLAQSSEAADPNQLSVVMLARWHRFSMLLPADAEAESIPIEVGPIDVLKVAHHGSEDSGLGELLDRTAPGLAIISVGAANPFGHPAPSTLGALASRGVRTLRTDLDGTVVLDVGLDSIALASGH